MVFLDRGVCPEDGVEADEQGWDAPAQGAQAQQDSGLGDERHNQHHEQVDAWKKTGNNSGWRER